MKDQQVAPKVRPNYDVAVQTRLLSYMVADPEAFARVSAVFKPEYFDDTLRPAYEYIEKFSQEFGGLPTTGQIRDFTKINIPVFDGQITEAHRAWFVKEAGSFAKHRAIEIAIFECVDLIEQSRYEETETKIREALSVGIIKDIGIEYHTDPLARLKKIRSEMGTLRTGFDLLDHKLENVGPGQLMIALALSGGGKSLFMQNVALNIIAQRKNVVYISLELGEEQIGLRVDAMNLDWSTREILDNMEQAAAKIVATKQQHGTFQMVKFPSGINISVIRNYLKEYQIRTGIRPDVLFVDYMDLMTPSQKRVDPANVSLRDKLVSEELRNLAFENNLLVVTAAQFNRSGYAATNAETNSVPGTGNIAGGITKVYTADVVISVLLTSEMREAGRGLFVLEKTRNSKFLGAKVPFSYNMDTMKMGSIAEDDFQMPHTRPSPQQAGSHGQKRQTTAKANIDKISKFTTL